MPVISTIFGIDRSATVVRLHRGVIRIFYNEDGPPHFHAEFQGQRGKFDLNGELIGGDVQSGLARRVIKKWTLAHLEEITANWKKMKAGKGLDSIGGEEQR